MSSKDLYRIREGLMTWTFTSSNEAEVYNGETYYPRVCGRSELQDKSQVGKNTLDVTFSIEDEMAIHFMQSPVDFAARLDVFSKDEDGNVFGEFRGTLSKTAPDNDKIKLTFNSIFSSKRKAGTRPTFQRSCRHTVYNPGCKIVYEEKRIAATVTALSPDGLTLTIPEAAALAEGVLTSGVVEFSDGTMRWIASHLGSTVTMIRVSPTLQQEFDAAGTVNVYIAPGCNQSTAWCDSVFDNLLNHGGFPYIPLKNPGGSAIA